MGVERIVTFFVSLMRLSDLKGAGAGRAGGVRRAGLKQQEGLPLPRVCPWVSPCGLLTWASLSFLTQAAPFLTAPKVAFLPACSSGRVRSEVRWAERHNHSLCPHGCALEGETCVAGQARGRYCVGRCALRALGTTAGGHVGRTAAPRAGDRPCLLTLHSVCTT